jgi:hypothetical protein
MNVSIWGGEIKRGINKVGLLAPFVLISTFINKVSEDPDDNYGQKRGNADGEGYEQPGPLIRCRYTESFGRKK